MCEKEVREAIQVLCRNCRAMRVSTASGQEKGDEILPTIRNAFCQYEGLT